MFVPWEAVPIRLNQSRLNLHLLRPDLVRRTGLRRLCWRSARLTTPCVDIRFLRKAIFHYLRFPAEQATIGTPDNYQRLVQALDYDGPAQLTAPPTAAPGQRPAP